MPPKPEIAGGGLNEYQGAAVGHLRTRVVWLRQASLRPQVPLSLSVMHLGD